jgi:hypothetical protein
MVADGDGDGVVDSFGEGDVDADLPAFGVLSLLLFA